MSANITIQFSVPAGYQAGDYARLHGNSGSGDINWYTPLTDDYFALFPGGGGIFGWGRAPWGRHPWGRCISLRVSGWGRLPWGRHPWGHGTGVINTVQNVIVCGDYKYAFACYDQLGNLHEGTPEEAEAYVHIAPPAPTGLKKNNYNKTTDVLILDVAA